MNERLGKLLSRSGGEFYEGFLGIPNTIRFTEDELKTFIELIVKECMQVSMKAVGMDAEYEAWYLIKQHFGVEE